MRSWNLKKILITVIKHICWIRVRTLSCMLWCGSLPFHEPPRKGRDANTPLPQPGTPPWPSMHLHGSGSSRRRWRGASTWLVNGTLQKGSWRRHSFNSEILFVSQEAWGEVLLKQDARCCRKSEVEGRKTQSRWRNDCKESLSARLLLKREFMFYFEGRRFKPSCHSGLCSQLLTQFL